MDRLGDNCHFNQNGSATPVAVLTDLDGKIILSNNIYGESVRTDQEYVEGKWVLSGCRVMLTRFWTTSTASIVLACHLSSQQSFPQLLPEALDIEGEFCLWMGYIESCRPVTPNDLDSEVGNLIRVFVGIVDNVKSTASASGGYTIMIQARDRMRWFMDSDIYFNPTSIRRSNYISRSDLLLDVARRALGANSPSYDGNMPEGLSPCEGCGKTIDINMNYIIDITSDTNGAGMPTTDSRVQDSISVPANIWYRNADAPLVGKTRTSERIVKSNPEFRIHSTREGISMNGGDEVGQTINFIINSQKPAEVFKALAWQEVYPTEVFQHNDGNLYYAPRGNDKTGLTDHKRFYRTYYYKIAPPETDVNQRLLVLREERSSIGLKTNFIVSKSSPLADDDVHQDLMIHLQATPYALRDKQYACKFTRLHDPTIKDFADSAIIASTMARIHAKEVNVGLARMLGDPSIVPGEIMQIIGSPLLPDGGIHRAAQDLTKFYRYDESWNELVKKYAELSSGESEQMSAEVQSSGINFHDGSKAIFEEGTAKHATSPEQLRELMESMLCQNKSKVMSGEGNNAQEGFNEIPRTIFRVEAVAHKFQQGSKGFTTEVSLVTPF